MYTWSFEERLFVSTSGHEYKEEACVLNKEGADEIVVGIYEPHGCFQIPNTNLCCLYGHEEIKHINLETGEVHRVYTR